MKTPAVVIPQTTSQQICTTTHPPQLRRPTMINPGVEISFLESPRAEDGAPAPVHEPATAMKSKSQTPKTKAVHDEETTTAIAVPLARTMQERSSSPRHPPRSPAADYAQIV